MRLPAVSFRPGRRAVVVVLAAVLALGVVPAQARISKARRQAPGPAFGFTNYAAPGGLGTEAGEPSIGVNHKTGNVLFQAYTQTLRVHFDDTKTPATATWADKSYQLGAISLDPILFTDSATGRSMVSQLVSAAAAAPVPGGCSLAATTTDDGDTWTPSEGCSTPGGADHQTVGGGPLVAPIGTEPDGHGLWYCSQDVVTARCGVSRDGGTTFGPGLPMYNLIGPGEVGVGSCGGLHGHIKIAPDGTAYVPNQDCYASALDSSSERQAVVTSRDDGMTWSVDAIPDSHYNDFRSDPSVGIGSAGTVYFAYEDVDGSMKVATKQPNGAWTPSVDLGAGQGLAYTVFPTVVAGDDDRAAVAYLGTTTKTSDPALYEDDQFSGEWHLYVSMTYDRGATWTTVDATPTDPVQRGCIYWGNGDCPSEQRNLLDFMDATVDASGRVLVAYADGCVRDCVTGAPNSRTALGTIARLSCGRGLFALSDGTLPKDCPTPPTVRTAGDCPADGRFTDPAGDAGDVVVVSGAAPSEPSLDIREGWVDGDTGAMTLHARFEDLQDAPPPGASGRYYRYDFTVGGVAYEATLAQESGTDPSFSLGLANDDPTAPGPSMTPTGSYDVDSDTISIVVPYAGFQQTFHVALGPGTYVSALGLIAQRETGVVTPTADDASGTCSARL